jgi:hypothetical protein
MHSFDLQFRVSAPVGKQEVDNSCSQFEKAYISLDKFKKLQYVPGEKLFLCTLNAPFKVLVFTRSTFYMLMLYIPILTH